MTDQGNATEAVIDDALAVIDEALAKMTSRELVSTGEVADLLLDVRTLLTSDGHSGEVSPMVVEVESLEPIASEPV